MKDPRDPAIRAIQQLSALPMNEASRAEIGTYLRHLHRYGNMTWAQLGYCMGVSAGTAAKRAREW